MFQHVTVLVSFIFAIALTHVFSSASALLLGRDRVRFFARRVCGPGWLGQATLAPVGWGWRHVRPTVWFFVFYTLGS